MDPTPPTPWAPAMLLSLVALSACSDAGGTVEETDAVTGTSASGAPDGYPSGPYGADVGEIMPNLMWRGFVDDDGAGLATDGPYVDVSLDDVRRGGARWALVHFGTVF